MTNQQHPITPPRELVDKWIIQSRRQDYSSSTSADYVAIQAAQWGYEQRGAVNEAELQKVRDEELEACCEVLENDLHCFVANELRAARRPKPKSQAEEALEAQSRMWAGSATHDDWELVRSALERLRELEGGDDRTTGANQ